jgi:iron(III) transport system ATP-binding protein
LMISNWLKKTTATALDLPCQAPGALQVQALSVQHERQTLPALSAVSFCLAAEATGALLGPSGCGKTTLLRALAGFVRPSAGEIWLGAQALVTAKTFVRPEQRGIGMVFQDLALFPHLTVTENIAFGIRHWPWSRRRDQVQRLLNLVDLQAFSDVYPGRLSGGQQRRVALARALAPQPRLLLLDEPFSGLEIRLRQQLIREIRDILKSQGVGGLLVTHHPEEAYRFADVIGVMQKRELLQWDAPYKIYHQPATPFVAHFTGLSGWLPAERQAAEISTVAGRFPLPEAWPSAAEHAFVLLRPEDVVFAPESLWRLPIAEVVFNGADFLYHLRLPDDSLIFCVVPSHVSAPLTTTLPVRLAIKHWVIFTEKNPPLAGFDDEELSPGAESWPNNALA